MKKKLLCMFVVTLLIAGFSTSVMGSINVGKSSFKNINIGDYEEKNNLIKTQCEINNKFEKEDFSNKNFENKNEVKLTENPKNGRSSDWFYMDFNPSGDPKTLNGGRFEGESWTCDHDEWEVGGNNDPFDDTGDMSWTSSSYKGIYSAVRNDEDLNDGTSTDGAWCSCAKETGGAWPWDNEDSRGWATVKKSFDLSDFVNTDLPNFAFTDVELKFDYKMYSNDFNDGNSHVYLNGYLKQGSNKWPLRYFWFSGADDAPEETEGGYCIDVFDPSYTHQWHEMSNPNYVSDDFLIEDYVVDTNGQGWMDVDPLYELFNDNGDSYTLEFKIFVRCYGAGAGCSEQYQFWIDHVRFKCYYEYYYPDLTVEDIWIEPSNFDPGDSVTLKANVKNIGVGDAEDTFYVLLYILYQIMQLSFRQLIKLTKLIQKSEKKRRSQCSAYDFC